MILVIKPVFLHFYNLAYQQPNGSMHLMINIEQIAQHIFCYYLLLRKINWIFASLKISDTQHVYKNINMKKDLHPSSYRFVVFKDMSNDYSFLTKSCVDTKESITWEDGNEYPLYKLEISHTSHPFYTGKMKLVDTAGRIDKFKTRYAKK